MTQLEETHRLLLDTLNSDSFKSLSELDAKSLRIKDSYERHLDVKVVRRLLESVLKHGDAIEV